MTYDVFLEAEPDQLATFVQEYLRYEGEPDAGPRAVIASQLRAPMYLPHQVAEILLAKAEIQAALKLLRGVAKAKVTKEVSVDTISTDMEVIYQRALEARQFTAAIGAKKLQAELHRMVGTEININVKHTVTTMTDAELEAIAKRGVIDGEYTDVTETTGLPAVVATQRH